MFLRAIAVFFTPSQSNRPYTRPRLQSCAFERRPAPVKSFPCNPAPLQAADSPPIPQKRNPTPGCAGGGVSSLNPLALADGRGFQRVSNCSKSFELRLDGLSSNDIFGIRQKSDSVTTPPLTETIDLIKPYACCPPPIRRGVIGFWAWELGLARAAFSAIASAYVESTGVKL